MTHVCSFLFLVLSSSIWCTACFVSNSAGGHGTGSALSAVKPNHKVEFRSESGVVTPVTSISDRKNLISSLRTFSVATAVLASVLSSGNNPAEASTSDVDRNYFDKENGFAIDIPLGFSSMPRKKGGGDSLSTGQPVEILLVAQDFLKGASLSIGRSDVPQLLNDFSVPWAGKPINSIADVGTANIVSELLILQRQGAFGSIFFKTKLGVTAANDAELTNMDNNISEIISASLDLKNDSVMFEFKTPLSAGIRYTIANSFLKGKFLYTVWLSVLGPIYATDYREQLIAARNSFRLL